MVKIFCVALLILLSSNDMYAQTGTKFHGTKAEIEFSTLAGWSELTVVAGGQVIYRIPVSRDLRLGVGVQSLITGDDKGHHGILGEISTRFGRRDQFSLGVQVGKSIGYKKRADDYFATGPQYEYYYDRERFTQFNLMYHFKSQGRLRYSLGGFLLLQNARLNHYPKGMGRRIIGERISIS